MQAFDNVAVQGSCSRARAIRIMYVFLACENWPRIEITLMLRTLLTHNKYARVRQARLDRPLVSERCVR